MNSVRIHFYNSNIHDSFEAAQSHAKLEGSNAVSNNGSFIEPDGNLSNIQDIREVVEAMNEMYVGSIQSHIVAVVVDSEGKSWDLDEYISSFEGY